ncbi:hypothetical protein Sango_0795900 [Sesamum angolense]|uniref:Reverse transcriptase Ty1/copia-type domain-containing protein n=1 Tax=Sesamum angolense TaxID=2727404 RepID=A0AAE1X2W7_9LAMI|nr:hypothetical protein Sango_0795900 [Sesamum angolense]
MQSLKRKFEVLTIKDNESIKSMRKGSDHASKLDMRKRHANTNMISKDNKAKWLRISNNRTSAIIATNHATSSCRETWLTDSGCTNQMKPELNNFRDLDWPWMAIGPDSPGPRPGPPSDGAGLVLILSGLGPKILDPTGSEAGYGFLARYETIRLLVALAAKMGQKIHHLDVKSAFVNGVLEEDIYVETHEGV